MNLEGDLGNFDLLPMLIDLSRQKFTGAVRFERDAIIKIVYFREGDVLSASTNDPMDAVDETLVRAGKITRDHVRQAVAQRKENESIADSLLALGFITRKELSSARRVQLVGILRSVAAWPEGTYSVVPDYLPKRDEGTLFHLPQIIVESIVTETDRERVEEKTDGGAAVYRKASGFDEQYSHLGLNDDANAVVQHIDGQTPASQLTVYSSEEPFTVFKLLVALELLGLIERADKAQGVVEVQEPQVKDEVLLEPLPSSEPPASSPVVRYGAEKRGPRRRGLLLIGLAMIVAFGIAGFVLRQQSKTSPPNQPPDAKTRGRGDTVTESARVAASPSPDVEVAASPPRRVPASPQDALRERYDAMAAAFARERAATPFSLQIEIVCQTESVTRAREIGSDQIWFVPIQFRGQRCYRVFWGSYGTRAAAEQAMVEVPAVFTAGGTPVVIEVRQVLRP